MGTVKWMIPAVLLCVFLSGSAIAQEQDTEALKKQMQQMREEFDRMKREYEAKMEEMRKRIEELESLAPETLKMKAKQERIQQEIRKFMEEAEKEREERELEEIRRAAQAAVAETVEKPAEKLEEMVFKSGGLGLQALNPEISVAGDMIYRFVYSGEAPYADYRDHVERSRFLFRVLDFHIQSYLDPYTRLKAAVGVHEDGAGIGEAYFTRFGIFPGVNLTLGKFRQQFGVVNRWHLHSLDQVTFPLALTEIFGPEGLNQTGVSLEWTMPQIFGASQELTLQLTNSENERVLAGEFMSYPAFLFHYKNYRDITKDLYFEFGVSGLIGSNSHWGWRDENGVLHDDAGRITTVWGADMTWLWEPTEKMRYRNLLWRTEFYYLNMHVSPPEELGLGQDTIETWGLYSYLQAKISRTIEIGIRGDFYKADSSKDYFIPHLAYREGNAYRWQIGPYITWWQSPWVKFRLEYNHLDGRHIGPPEDRIFLQCVFAAGPHKHERY